MTGRPTFWFFAAAFFLAGCDPMSGEPNNTSQLSIKADGPEDGRLLETLRLFVRQGTTRAPDPRVDDHASEGIVLQLSEQLDPTREPVRVGFLLRGGSFEVGLATFFASASIGDEVISAWQGAIDLSPGTVTSIRLERLPAGCDNDRDGFLSCGVAGCCEPEVLFADCDPEDATAHPWAVEPECEPCADTVDQDCDGADRPCVDEDEDRIEDCLEEQRCGLGDPNSGPGKHEICDGVDNDCDGDVDEDLALPVPGGDPIPLGEACGLGVCAGGTVVCADDGSVRCNTDQNAADYELCEGPEEPQVDDDCDGDLTDGCEPDDLDGDSFTPTEGDCNDYDSATYPGSPAEKCCLAVLEGTPDVLDVCDRNCDGEVTYCDEEDLDGDGHVPPLDCDETDPQTYPDAPEKCGDGVDQDCFGGDTPCADVTDGDGDGWSPPADCDDNADSVYPDAPEACNHVDDDCDGFTDEENADGGSECGDTTGECELGVVVCSNTSGVYGTLVCEEDVEPTDELCDYLDNDCDGDTDEDFEAELGTPCDRDDDLDGCKYGVLECLPDGSGTACLNEDPDVVVEKADGFDNDCDGTIDEGANVCAGQTIACPDGFMCAGDKRCSDAAGRVFVPAGTTVMGCNFQTDDACEADANGLHMVSLSAFAIDRTEVTCGDYCNADCSNLPAVATALCVDLATSPIVDVTWDEARAHCQSKGADLCTEAQWERAARGNLIAGQYGEPRTYPWGEQAPSCTGELCHFNESNAGCGTDVPASVYDYEPGASFFGALQMAGNVREWVLDWYEISYYYDSPPEDPTGPENGDERVIRGGDWKGFADKQYSYRRDKAAPDTSDDRTGFRCCAPVPAPIP